MHLRRVLVALAVLIAGCTADTDAGPAAPPASTSTMASATVGTTQPPDTPTSVTTSQAPTTVAQAAEIPPLLAARTIRRLTIDGETWLVAVADTPTLRSSGLMFVEDLLDLDGMVFVWPDDTTSAFWMQDTLIPLDIAFFDAAGVLLEVLSMLPCEVEDCPTYGIDRPYRYAVEARPGAFAGVAEGALLELP